MTDMEIYTQNKPDAQYKGFIQEPQSVLWPIRKIIKERGKNGLFKIILVKLSYLSWSLVFPTLIKAFSSVVFRCRCWTDGDICCSLTLSMLKCLVYDLFSDHYFVRNLRVNEETRPTIALRMRKHKRGSSEHCDRKADGILLDECVQTGRVKPVIK